MMPQLCTICIHQERKEIDLAVIRGEKSNRAIANDFSVHESSLKRHRKEHLAPLIQQMQLEQLQADKIDCNLELAKVFRRVNKLFDACEDDLTDPLNPDKYILAPNADQITVVYYDGDCTQSGTPIKKRDSLAALLLRVEQKQGGLLIDTVKLKRVDASKRLLEAANTLARQIERVGRIFGLFNGNLDHERLESTRNAVIEVQRRLSQMHSKEWSWEETIDEMLLYNKTSSTAAYLNKLREAGPHKLLP
jgi:hypothetical protein